MKVQSKQTKRSNNYEEFALKKQIKFEDHNLNNCLYNKKEIRILWTDSRSKLKNYRIKVNLKSEDRDFHDPYTVSSSEESHVPAQPAFNPRE